MKNENEFKKWTKNALKVSMGIFFLIREKLSIKKESSTGQKLKKREQQKVHASTIALRKKREEKKKQGTKEEEKDKEGWTNAHPENLPSPTYWPFFLALGLSFLLWGIITSWVIILVGLLVFIIALGGWINILRHEK